jgi:hypothetical protein
LHIRVLPVTLPGHWRTIPMRMQAGLRRFGANSVTDRVRPVALS